MGWSPTWRRKRRAMKTVLTSADANETRGVLPSAMKNCNGCRRAVCTKARSSGLHARLARFKGYGLQLLHCRTHCNRRGRGRHGFSEAHGDVVGNVVRHLPQKASALEAEDAAPHAVKIHGDDGNLDVLHDAFQAAAEGKHLAGARDLALGEDADDLVVAQRVARSVQRVQHLARMQLAGNRDGLHHLREGLDDRGGRRCP